MSSKKDLGKLKVKFKNNPIMQNSNNITGVTGEYYVCAELGYRGILAIPTPKNNTILSKWIPQLKKH